LGQKVNPIGYRIGVNKHCESTWFATKEDYIDKLHEDLKIKKYVKNRLQSAMISKVTIERKTKSVTVDVHTARPGQVIGRKGAEIEKLRNELTVLVNNDKNTDISVFVNVQEIKNPWGNAFAHASCRYRLCTYRSYNYLWYHWY
jgi:small subunit ribosomal protein S3